MYMTNMKTISIFFIAITLWLCGCGKSFDDFAAELNVAFDNHAAGGRRTPSFKVDISPILTQRCALAGCHVVRWTRRC